MGAACCCITAPDDDPPQNTSAPRAHLGATLAQVTIQADTPNTRGSRASSVGDLNPRLSDKSTKLAATKRKKHMHRELEELGRSISVDEGRGRSASLAMTVATLSVKYTSALGRRGPAEGSVLDEGGDAMDIRLRHSDSMREFRSASMVRSRSSFGSGSAKSGSSLGADGSADDEEEAEDPAEAFVGLWQNVRTDNLEEYLKHIGIGWAKRKLAVGFKPVGSWGIVDGVLQVMVPTPLGDRLETFPLAVTLPTTDPDSGRAFEMTTVWEPPPADGGPRVLCTTTTDPLGKKGDFVTRRWVETTDNKAVLVQHTTHDGMSFKRYFEPKPE